MSRALRSPGPLLAAVPLAALLLSACGSDGGDPSGAGVGGAAFTRGAITAKSRGSITVNGVVLATSSGTAIRIEEEAGGADDLKPGMIVTVHRHLRRPQRHRDRDRVRGRGHRSGGRQGERLVSVGGTEVRVDDSTEFGEDNPLRLGSVSVGDRVRVSGVPDDHGGLRASRIDDDAGTGEDLELKGFVSDLTATGFTLNISPDDASGYAVTLAAGATLPAGLADGAYVEVRSAGPVTAGAIVAASVSLEDRHGDADEVEFEGIVTSGTSAEFMVDGVTVRTSGATRWQHGVPADLVPGTKVEVEGALDAGGVLLAEKVSFRAVIRIQAAVADLVPTDTGARFTLLGIPVTVGVQTELDDALASISAGDVVELRGMPDRSGTGVVGLRVRLRNDERIELQGLVEAEDEAAGTVRILGITVQTGAGTSFHDSGDMSGFRRRGPLHEPCGLLRGGRGRRHDREGPGTRRLGPLRRDAHRRGGRGRGRRVAPRSERSLPRGGPASGSARRCHSTVSVRRQRAPPCAPARAAASASSASSAAGPSAGPT